MTWLIELFWLVFSEFSKTTVPVTLDSEFPAKVEVDVNNDFQPSDQSSLEKEGKLNWLNSLPEV